jgi:cyclic pyranopterin phosphate synthase
MGIRKVRFTGGEPTLYPRLVDLVTYARSLDLTLTVALTTNGTRLTRLMPALGAAGLDSVNVSLDTLRPDRFRHATTADCLDTVLEGLKTAAGLVPVKINCVVIKGFNDDETADMVAFADRLGVDIRFIEYMPSRIDAFTGERYLPGDEVRAQLPYDLQATEIETGAAARYYRAPELKIRVGFINPVSHPFCADCRRLRLAADGRLYACLFSKVSSDLHEALDSGPDAARQAVNDLIAKKRGTSGLTEAATGTHFPSFVSMGG